MKAFTKGSPEIEMTLEEAMLLQVKLAEVVQRLHTTKLISATRTIEFGTYIDDGSKQVKADKFTINIFKTPV